MRLQQLFQDDLQRSHDAASHRRVDAAEPSPSTERFLLLLCELSAVVRFGYESLFGRQVLAAV